MIDPKIFNFLLIALLVHLMFFAGGHKQQANKYQLTKALGFDTSAKEVRIFLALTPIIFALREKLGLKPVFEKLGLSSASSIVQI